MTSLSLRSPCDPARPRAITTVACALAIFGLAACDEVGDGQSNDVDSCPGEGLCESDDAAAACIETQRDIGLEEATDLGFTAAEVLATVAGDHAQQLRWMDAELTGVGTGDTTISFSLDTENPSEIVLVESEANPDSHIDIDPACRDRLLITAGAKVRTTDGMLDESLAVRISSEDPQRVSWRGELSAADIAGAFPQTPADPDMALTQIDLTGSHDATDDTTSGSVGAGLESKGNGDDGVAAFGIVGAWGDMDATEL